MSDPRTRTLLLPRPISCLLSCFLVGNSGCFLPQPWRAACCACVCACVCAGGWAIRRDVGFVDFNAGAPVLWPLRVPRGRAPGALTVAVVLGPPASVAAGPTAPGGLVVAAEGAMPDGVEASREKRTPDFCCSITTLGPCALVVVLVLWFAPEATVGRCLADADPALPRAARSASRLC